VRVVKFAIHEIDFADTNVHRNLCCLSQVKKGFKLYVELCPRWSSPVINMTWRHSGTTDFSLHRSGERWVSRLFEALRPIEVLRQLREIGVRLEVRLSAQVLSLDDRIITSILYGIDSTISFTLEAWQKIILAGNRVSEALPYRIWKWATDIRHRSWKAVVKMGLKMKMQRTVTAKRTANEARNQTNDDGNTRIACA
jgi:hypothetical protein